MILPSCCTSYSTVTNKVDTLTHKSVNGKVKILPQNHFQVAHCQMIVRQIHKPAITFDQLLSNVIYNLGEKLWQDFYFSFNLYFYF